MACTCAYCPFSSRVPHTRTATVSGTTTAKTDTTTATARNHGRPRSHRALMATAAAISRIGSTTGTYRRSAQGWSGAIWLDHRYSADIDKPMVSRPTSR